MKTRHRREDLVRLFEERDEEKLTLRELSDRSGVPMGTLGYWSTKLRREKEEAAPALVPVEFVEPNSEGTVTVLVGAGIRLLVEPDFDATHLGRLLDVLSARC